MEKNGILKKLIFKLMKLVDSKELRKVASLNWFGGNIAAKIMMHALQLNKLNKLYNEVYTEDGSDFTEALLHELGIKVEISEEDLKKIPKEGPFITVSNHPFGGIDGIILLNLLSELRPDYKVMANFLLQKIDPLKDKFLGVNPFEDRKKISSTSGLKEAIKHIREGNAMGIFPAGEVSSYQSETNHVADREWQSSALKLIKNASVPVIPVYFHGSNSLLFHLLGFIHPILRTIKLPSELLNKKNRVIRLRIGNPISVKDQKAFEDISQYGRFLRAKTYLLESSLEVRKFFNYKLRANNKVEDIAPEIEKNILLNEVEALGDKYLLVKNKNFRVYCSPSVNIPNILNEIGRLREITFRGVEEGTNRSIDIDEFDLYYNHLFIWDEDEEKIVGAYRVGKGKEILEQYGLKGWYIQSLFKIKKGMIPILEESMELGRSFIVPEYQKKPLPLYLLWKGILLFLLKNPDYRYLIGPVTISGKYTSVSKGLIIKFIMANYFDYDIARYIKSRTKFKVKTNDIDVDFLLETAQDDIKKLDKYIGDIEPSNDKLPVLLKKYISLNAKLIGFNVDPKFNSCLDGLLYVDLYDVPKDVISSLCKELNDKAINKRFLKGDLDAKLQ